MLFACGHRWCAVATLRLCEEGVNRLIGAVFEVLIPSADCIEVGQRVHADEAIRTVAQLLGSLDRGHRQSRNSVT